MIRPRGWLLAGAVAGSLGGAFLAASLILPALAPYLAAAGVFLGVTIGALLMRRARDQELVDALTAEDEQAADRHWELSDIAAHYRQTSAERRKAELASDAKSRFLTMVSHELRTPLGGIIGLTEVLDATPLSAEQKSFATAIRSSGTLMLGLVDDMLDFAKIEAGRFDLSPRPTLIEPLLEEIAELFFNRADSKGLDLATYVDPNLPASMEVDPERLRQVLINLVGNAIKFTDKGGVTIIAAPDHADPSRVRFSVEDTGPGVPAELAARIFDEFERLPSDSDRRVTGSGLGLGIAKRIVGHMGSDIGLSDRPEGGAGFSFALPIAASGESGGSSNAIAGRRVLVVAPIGPGRDALVRHYVDASVTVQVADTPSLGAALAGAASAAREGFDLLLVDQRSTAMASDSVSLIRDAVGKRIPAAILIAPGRRRTSEEYKADGLDAYLVRPLRRRSLLRITESLVTGDTEFGVDPVDVAAPPANTPRSRTGLRVLLAEDDDVNALLLRSMLLRLGHDVKLVGDGDSALVAARNETFDVMLIDLSLPNRDGFAVAEGVRALQARDDAKAPLLIAVTADARTESREQAIAAGFDRYLVKPLTPKALGDLLEVTGAAAA